VRHPVAHRFADRVLERAAAGIDRANACTQELHALDVERLALHVDAPHVDFALEAEERGRRGGRDSVLAGSRFGDDSPLPHPARQQALTDRVVDLVGAGVRQVLALEVDSRPDALGEARRVVERRRPADEVALQGHELGLEARIPPGGGAGRFELDERGHERLGHEAPPYLCQLRCREAPGAIWWVPGGVRDSAVSAAAACVGSCVAFQRRYERRHALRS
jgi:hypothetical protein